MSVSGVNTRVKGVYDVDLEMKDAGLVAASTAATVDDVAKIIDLGTGTVNARIIIDVSAIEIATNDEKYDICVQLSSKSDFADTIETPVKLELGASETLLGDQDSTVGRYEIFFSNVYNGTYYQYARLYTVVAGTIATGINYSAYMAKVN